MGRAGTYYRFAEQALGSLVLRYGLVLVIGWIGLMKFTEYEANGIQSLVAHSPLMSWMYDFLTVRAFRMRWVWSRLLSRF